MQGFRMKLTGWAVLVGLVFLGFLTGSVKGAEGTLLRLKLEKGKKYQTYVLMDLEGVVSTEGVEQKFTMEMGMGLTYEVKKVDAKKSMHLSVKFHRLRYKMKDPIKDVDYDSARGKKAKGAWETGYGALVGKGFEMTVSPMGKVSGLKGMEKLLKDVSKEVVGTKNEKVLVMSEMGDIFGKDSMGAYVESWFDVFPKKAVNVGDQWKKTHEDAGSMPYLIETTYTVKSIKDGRVNLVTVSVMKNHPKRKPKLEGLQRVEMSGRVTGTESRDLKTGMTVHGDASMLGEAKMFMAFDGVEIAVPMKMKMKVKVRPGGVK